MSFRTWAAVFFLCTPAPCVAADWWWVGFSGAAPNRVVSYVDVETIAAGKDGQMEVWSLGIGEARLPNGQQHQANHYAVKCGARRMALMERVAYDSEGSAMELSPIPAGEFEPVAADSIGESILQLVCGRPSGMEARVAEPMRHAFEFLVGGQPGRAEAPPEGRQQDEGLAAGTGFFIGPDGYVLTSYHVVERARRIGCRTPDGAVHAASVARMSAANDVALLRVETRPPHYLGFAPPNSVRPGDRVFTIGYGAVNFLGISEPRFTDGTVSALSGAGAEDAYMQVSVPVQPGNSGGPLVNEAGQVVGIIAAQAAVDAFLEVEGTLPQSINWAVKAEYAAPLLAPLPAGRRLPRDQAIELARNAICLVIAESGSN